MFDFPASPSLNQRFVPTAGGPAWQWNGTAWMSSGGSALGMQIIERVYLASGTWTKPDGLLYLEVEIQSPGGGGGGAGVTGAGVFAAGGGGGAGAWGRQQFDAASLASSVAFTIGAIGAGGIGTNAGTQGGTCSFSTLSVLGGGGAGGGTQIATGSYTGGGPGSVSGGSVAATGARGFASYMIAGASLIYSGQGAASPFGSPGNAIIGGNANGVDAAGYGAGGSGGANIASQGTTKTGGNGAPAFIKVREYYGFTGTAPAPGTIIRRVYTSSTTWTKPAGLISAEIEALGGGGAGGGNAATSATQFGASGGGGGGGWGSISYDASALPASFTVTVGAAGVGVSAGSGGTGGATIVNGLTAGGGNGGSITGAQATGTPFRAAGGAGGNLSGFDLNIRGEYGSDGIASLSTTAGMQNLKGRGGASFYGYGQPEQFAVAAGSVNAFGGFGAGASGLAVNVSTAAGAGGNGGPGLVIIKEFY